MIKQVIALASSLLTLTSCADPQSKSIYVPQEEQKARHADFEKQLGQNSNNPKTGQIGPEGDLNLVSDVSFDQIARQSVKHSRGGAVFLLNGYATGSLDMTMPPHPFRTIAQLAKNPVINVKVSGYPITDEHLADLNELPITGVNLSSTDVKTLSPLRGNTRLQNIYLGDTRINHEAMVTLSQMHNLQTIDISGTNISGKDLLLLKNLSALHNLTLKNCRNISEVDVANLVHCTSAKRLHVDYNENAPRVLHEVDQLASHGHLKDADELLLNTIHKYEAATPVNHQWLCQAYTKRASIYLTLNNWPKAEEYGQESVQYSDSQAVDSRTRVAAFRELGQIYEAKAKYKEAIAILQKGLATLHVHQAKSNYDALTNECQLDLLVELVNAAAASNQKKLLLETVRQMDALWNNANLSIPQLISQKVVVGKICLAHREHKEALRLFQSAASVYDADGNNKRVISYGNLQQLIQDASTNNH